MAQEAQQQMGAAACAAAAIIGAGGNIVSATAAAAASAGVAAGGAAGAALEANQAAANAQRDREEFALATSKAKAVLNPSLVIMLMLYPSVIAFSITARYMKYSLLIPTPNAPGTPADSAVDGPHNEWVTTNPLAYLCTSISFIVVTGIHIHLLSYRTVRGPPGSPMMAVFYAWYAPITFWAATSLYYLIFTAFVRYGVAPMEWMIAGTFSGVLLLVTLILICRAMSLSNVMATVPAPAPAQVQA